jgi:hypothetical protein
MLQLSLGWGLMEQAPHVPPEHFVVPPAHVPFAPRRFPQVSIIPLMQEHPSFGVPLQFASFPWSHVSVDAGVTSPMHGPQAVLPLLSWQVCIPPWQGPLPLVLAGPS